MDLGPKNKTKIAAYGGIWLEMVFVTLEAGAYNEGVRSNKVKPKKGEYMMFDLIPFGRHREDAFSQLAKTLNDVFQDDFFAPFQNSPRAFRTDIREAEDAYLVEADLPGFRKEDIEIDYAAPYLTIKAVRNEDSSMEDTNQHLVRKERRYGEYVRRFYVQDIEEDSIRASLKDGVLKLEVPKRQPTRSKRIHIQDGD